MCNYYVLIGSVVLNMELNIADLIGFGLTFVGMIITAAGAFLAMAQWRQGNLYKRSEFVQQLITKVRDDEDISLIMDALDWNEGLEYYGKFRVHGDCKYERLKKFSDDELFRKVDKSLSHFSYICYLHKKGCLKRSDMYHFEYELRRIVDNRHMANYLYSLYHWSTSIGTNCSFKYLIDYSIKKGYLRKKEFKSHQSNDYYISYLYSYAEIE